jgi:hypothetical protein
MAKRYYNLEKETKTFLKRMEGTSGFSLNNAGVQAVNNYFIFRKANSRSIPNSTSTLTKSFAGGTGANTQYMSCASNSTLNFTTAPLTWIVWVKLANITCAIISKGTGGPQFAVSGNFFKFQKAGTSEISSNTTPDNTWQLAACWYDGTNYYIQINNGVIVSAVLAGGFTSNTTDFRIGTSRGFADPSLTGQASRIWQWSRVLTADERTLLYNSGNGRSFLEAIYYSPSLLNGLISYWPLNELSGTSDGRDLYGTNTLIANNNPTVTAGIIEEIL